MKKFGSIDIGSNTVRLLIMEADDAGGFKEVDSERVICRLGEGINSEKRLLPHRMDLTLDVLQRFRDQCRKYGDIPIRVVATSAVREASNREEFVRLAQERAGLDVQVISWEEEARLTVEGCSGSFLHPAKHSSLISAAEAPSLFFLRTNRCWHPPAPPSASCASPNSSSPSTRSTPGNIKI